MTREEIEALGDEEIIFFDGYDDAIVGLGTRFGMYEQVVVDKNKVISILMKDMEVDELETEDLEDGFKEIIIQNMKYEMALEYFDFNVIGGWYGDRTPMFIELSV